MASQSMDSGPNNALRREKYFARPPEQHQQDLQRRRMIRAQKKRLRLSGEDEIPSVSVPQHTFEVERPSELPAVVATPDNTIITSSHSKRMVSQVTSSSSGASGVQRAHVSVGVPGLLVPTDLLIYSHVALVLLTMNMKRKNVETLRQIAAARDYMSNSAPVRGGAQLQTMDIGGLMDSTETVDRGKSKFIESPIYHADTQSFIGNTLLSDSLSLGDCGAKLDSISTNDSVVELIGNDGPSDQKNLPNQLKTSIEDDGAHSHVSIDAHTKKGRRKLFLRDESDDDDLSVTGAPKRAKE
ncbi:hypothetical protein BUALT_Bualt01G0245900 [Buddleja alternifolia]|uniref:Uncharacterized protein n=1 Tax=Buddleja alternifolia TaxID=168488 RepID=A0AAV6YBE6_9LAMI|nr:hypothetical protein BUALT_Bualt01G0245900 [Buddleja alternifolia]